MSEESDRKRRLQLQRGSAVVFVVVMVIGVVLRSRGNSAGLTLIEIAIAVAIVAVILLVFRRNLGKSGGPLTDVRATMSPAWNCYYEGGKRGIVGQRDGELHLLRTQRGKAAEYLTLPAGGYQIARGDVAITAARRVDGLLIKAIDAGPADGGVRLALSHDQMTVMGNMLKGPELDQAVAQLQQGSQRSS